MFLIPCLATPYRPIFQMSRREVDGVVLGMGSCVVTEDGLWVPPTKMTLLEMRVELTAVGMEAGMVAGANRKELQKMIKVGEPSAGSVGN